MGRSIYRWRCSFQRKAIAGDLYKELLISPWKHVSTALCMLWHNFRQRSSGNSISHTPLLYRKLVIRNINLTANTYLTKSNRYNSKGLILLSSTSRSYTGDNIYKGLTWYRQEIPSTSETSRNMFSYSSLSILGVTLLGVSICVCSPCELMRPTMGFKTVALTRGTSDHRLSLGPDTA